jgi:MFS transporter, FSR family, fosmidomycin resistance protein
MIQKNNLYKKGTFDAKKVSVISWGHFSHDVFSSFLPPLLPLLIEKFSLSYALAGFLSVAQRLPSLFNPFVGILADRGWFRFMVISAPAITTVCMSALGVAPSFILLVLLLLVAGISSTFYHVPGPVLVRQVSGDRIGKGMSYFMLGGELARTVGPILALAAVSWWTLPGIYRLAPVGMVSSFLLYIQLRRVAPATLPGKTLLSHLHMTKRLSSFFMLIAGILFFRAFIKTALTLFLPTLLIEQGKSLWFGGSALAILQLAGAVGTFFAGSLSDKWGRKAILITVTLSTPFFSFLFLLTTGYLRFVALIFLGLVLLSSGPVLLAIIQDVRSDSPSFLNGIYMTLNFIISSGMALLVGGLADAFGLYKTFMVCTFLAVFAFPFILRLKDKETYP